MASTPTDKKFWKEFIEIQRSSFALWRIKSDRNRNRNLKSESCEKFIHQLKGTEATRIETWFGRK
jgi:hypothetical protein